MGPWVHWGHSGTARTSARSVRKARRALAATRQSGRKAGRPPGLSRCRTQALPRALPAKAQPPNRARRPCPARGRPRMGSPHRFTRQLSKNRLRRGALPRSPPTQPRLDPTMLESFPQHHLKPLGPIRTSSVKRIALEIPTHLNTEIWRPYDTG
jgi:hypothetical protein